MSMERTDWHQAVLKLLQRCNFLYQTWIRARRAFDRSNVLRPHHCVSTTGLLRWIELQTSEQWYMIARTAVARRFMHPSFNKVASKHGGDENHVNAVAAHTKGLATWVVSVCFRPGV